MVNLKLRFQRIVYEFPIGITLFCEIYMVLAGVALLIEPLHPTIPRASEWHRWGTTGLVVIGALFVLLGAYGALFRERQTGLMPTFLVAGIEALQSLHPLNLIGLIFAFLLVASAIAEARERVERARLRRWKIMVPRDSPPRDGAP